MRYTGGRRRIRASAAAVGLLAVAACSDFLSGPGLSTDPNVPTTATPDQLWVGVQVTAMQLFESQYQFSAWAQFVMGTDKQWLGITDYSFGVSASDANYYWDVIYGGGGLKDLRTLEAGAVDASPPNLKLRGEARVMEALYMGTAADIFGNVPYSAALSAHPTFDTQAQVYAHVQAVLDSAIADLDGTGAGTTSIDFFYANSFAKWKAAAHSLKARFYMHTARTSATAYDVGTLGKVITEAAAGISASTGDLQVNHGLTGNAANDQNLYYFLQSGTVSAPSAITLGLMHDADEDYLLTSYYLPNLYHGFLGILPDESHASDSVSTFNVGRYSPTGIVTYSEVRMLLAEAEFRMDSTVAARSTLDAYRASIGAPPTLGSLPGDSLLEAILREKYIRPLPNLEQWNDYLRTCYPNLQLPQSVVSGTGFKYVPARLPVAMDEQIANAANVPPDQMSGNVGNPNDPKNDFAIDGVTTCYGQVQRPN